MTEHDTEQTWQVRTSYMTAGLVTKQGRVIEAAPILKWALYKPIEYVAEWVRGKGGRIEKVNAP